MPFTPFHLGPGIALKAVGGRYVNFMLFSASQIALDIEPLVRLFRSDAILHGYSHTYLGATVIGTGTMLIGKPLGEQSLRYWNKCLNQQQFYIQPKISWLSAAIGSFVGVYSHVLLDSLMHRDMHPLAPFSETNHLLEILSIGQLHLLCVMLGLLGLLSIFLTFIYQQAQST